MHIVPPPNPASAAAPPPMPPAGDAVSTLQAFSFPAVMRWVGTEVLWSADVFVRLTLSVLIAQVITKAVAQVLPQGLFQQSDSLLQGFDRSAPNKPATNGTGTSSNGLGEQPRKVFVFGDHTFYRHTMRYPGQEWPCALMIPDPCADCPWFVRGSNGAPYCAANAKLELRHHPQYAEATLHDMRDALEQRFKVHAV